MFYRSFFNECLVNLYFKKKYVLGGFPRQKYSFENTQSYLVNFTTYDDLNNLYLNNILIRSLRKPFLKCLKKIRKSQLTVDLIYKHWNYF